MKNIKLKLSYLCLALLVGFAFVACEIEEPVFEYVPIAQTATGEKLVSQTDLFAQVYSDRTYTLVNGVDATEIAYLSQKGLAMRIFIFEVDLSNPNVTIETSTPFNKPAFAMQQMTQQALYEDEPGHLVWGGINADFYNTTNGAPQGIVYKDGTAIKTTFQDNICTYFAITKDNKALVAGQDVYLSIRSTFKEAVGGRVWLLQEGIIPQGMSDAIEPRTAIGVSEDGLRVYMLAVDGRNFWYSNGMAYEELGKCMKALGAYNAINLDGGGSTTFFIRNTPEFTENRFEIRNWVYDNGGQERAVANGLVIISK